MTAFEKVCALSCEQWVDSLPTDIPKHKFTEKHNKAIDELLYGKPIEYKHKISKNSVKFLLIAAILLAVATTAVAVPSFREFTIDKFFNHSEYEVVDKGNYDEVDSLALNYIPEGFVRTDGLESDISYESFFENGEKNFLVCKNTLNAGIGFDTEKYPSEKIIINGVEAVYYRADDISGGIIFNNGKYIYSVDGNVGKEELVKIAQNIE